VRLQPRHFERGLHANEELGNHGGMMYKTAKTLRTTTNCTYACRQLHENVAARLQKKQTLLYVYDFVNTNSKWPTDLRFVRDAYRPPLSLCTSEDNFEQVYGLPSKITIRKPAGRSASHCDWWASLYR
jgi:hypothetical protein